MSRKRKYIEADSTSSDISVDEQLAAFLESNPKGLRPKFEIENLNFSKPFIFQSIELKAELDCSKNNLKIADLPTHPDNKIGGKPTIHAYGVTENANSVCVHIHGYRPYIYVAMPDNYNEETHKLSLIKCLNDLIKNERSGKICENPIMDIQICDKKSVYYYSEQGKTKHLKITLAIQEIVTCTRKLFEFNRVSEKFNRDNDLNNKLFFQQQTFESNIDFEVRFMVDNGIFGCSWLKINKYRLRGKNEKQTTCQIEMDVSVNNVKGFAPEGEWSKNASIKILSFDIECISGDGRFPDANKLTDKVIQISCVVKNIGDSDITSKVVLCLDQTDPIPDCGIVCFKTEEELLIGFRDYIVAIDPDFITGYNIQNFDFPYLVDKAKALTKANKTKNSEIANFGKFTRWKQTNCNYQIKKFQSKQMGNRENKEMMIDGRTMIDILPYVLREHKLRRYTLNAVASHFLRETKDDVKHTEIKGLFLESPKTRARLAHYCYIDSVLPLRLNDKLMVMVNLIEMARVTGVPMNYLILRGQSVKVLAQLLRATSEKDYIIPALKTGNSGDQFTGATVLEPKRDFYKEPIATLDFASLYPSIMRAHNLCYSSLVKKSDWSKIKEKYEIEKDYVITPNNDMFMQNDVIPGLLPDILTNLITARKKAKIDLKKETDPYKKAILDSRQLALKISANSVYGFTGAQMGKLPSLEISSSTTGYGRRMIEQSKNYVEEKYKRRGTYVIYGDTDSVMVNFKADSVKEAMDLGKEAADLISKDLFKSPIKLEFEKVYYPYLLMNKKRYAGMYYSSSNTVPDKMDMKGMESVRRDNCQIVGEILNGCLDCLLIQKSPESAITFACYKINRIRSLREDLSKLVISKELTKTREEYAAKQAHCELAHRMSIRDPGSAPKLGDRVPYIVVLGIDKKTPLYDRAEDPSYALENNLRIDVEYYIENQIILPLVRLFEPIYHSESKIRQMLLRDTYSSNIPKVLTETNSSVKTSTENKPKKKKNSMMAMLSKGAKGLKRVDIVTKRVIPDGDLFAKGENDAVDDVHLSNNTILNCLNNGQESELYKTRFTTAAELWYTSKEYFRLKTQCSNCLGSMQMDNMKCANNDCNMYYRRLTSKNESILAREKCFKMGIVGTVDLPDCEYVC